MFLHMRAAAADFCELVERNKDRYDSSYNIAIISFAYKE